MVGKHWSPWCIIAYYHSPTLVGRPTLEPTSWNRPSSRPQSLVHGQPLVKSSGSHPEFRLMIWHATFDPRILHITSKTTTLPRPFRVQKKTIQSEPVVADLPTLFASKLASYRLSRSKYAASLVLWRSNTTSHRSTPRLVPTNVLRK